MAAWLPVLKAVLPVVTNIVTTAIPAFTAQKKQSEPEDLVARQIGELQSAVTHNAESLKVLAEQLQRTVAAVEEGAQNLEQTVARYQDEVARAEQAGAALQRQAAELYLQLQATRRFGMGALGIGLAALGVALIALLR